MAGAGGEKGRPSHCVLDWAGTEAACVCEGENISDGFKLKLKMENRIFRKKHKISSWISRKYF